MCGARFLRRIDEINGSKGAMEGKGAGEIKFFFWLCLHKRIRTVELAATTTWTAGWLFTQKFGRRARELKGFQDCVNQRIDCMRIDIN